MEIELQPLENIDVSKNKDVEEADEHLPAGTLEHKKKLQKEKTEQKIKKRTFKTWREELPRNPRQLARYLWRQKGFVAFMGGIALLYLVCGITLWNHFSWAAWYTLINLWFTFGFLIKNYWDPALTLLGSMTSLMAPGILSAREAASGFGDTLILSLGALYVVAVAIDVTGCLTYLNKYLLSNETRSVRIAVMRLMIPTSLVSGFVNNTPLVAMLIPAIEQWCKKTGISPSKLMIPLSYASIVGNFSIIATSPNLVVIGLSQRIDPTIQFPFFEPGYVGAAIMGVAWLYMFTIGVQLLPDRKSASVDYMTNPNEYMLSVAVETTSPVVGKSIKGAGLRQLDGLFLAEIHRQDVHLPAVGKDTPILAGDLLIFAGDVHKVHDLLKVKGLRPTNQEGQIVQPIPGRILAEAIVGPRSTLVGKSIRESHFRHNYESAVISVFREGAQLKGKVGDMVVQPGDALLLVTKPGFVDNHKAFYNSDFVWVSQVGEHPIRFDHVKMITAVLVAITLYVLTAIEVVELATVSLVSAFTLVFSQCITLKQAFDSIDISVLVVIATSFSTALAVEKTGIAVEWASNLLQATEWAGTIGILAGVYLATTILTAVLSNVSSAAIMVPICFSLRQMAPVKALLYVVMHGASADFSTPIGYQTNLMVWGPGGYRFGDYFKVGFPLQICCGIVTIIVSYFAFTEQV